MNNIDRQQVLDWSTLVEGQKLIWITEIFGGHSETYCTVSDVFDDHVIAIEDSNNRPMSLWIDEDNQDQFYYIEPISDHADKVQSSNNIQGATYKKYNANTRGNDAPDCVKRAISMAFNLDYNQVSKLLLAKAKAKRKSAWNILEVYEPVIYDLGGNKGKVPSEPIQVEDFIDQYVREGVCIMETGRKPQKYGYGNHLTCCINGVLYDSWDSSDQYVCQYYMIENSSHEFTDIGDHIHELMDECADIVGQLWEKYRDKYNLEGEFVNLGKVKKTDFSFYYRLRYVDDVVDDTWNLACVFTPTMSPEAARKKMIETVKIRMYDRFYAINQKRKQSSEGDSLFYESGYTENDKRNLYLDSRERRFFDSLPGWIKPFIVYVNIQDPGQYAASYQLEALPIKGDPRRDTVIFYGYNSAEVKDEIARYRKNFERVDD